jgi:hypothetical protein
MSWIKFLRQYGPIATNDNMYDEQIQRSARRSGTRPILFDHPYRDQVLSCFLPERNLISVVLTGTAGDGKTHLCRQVWQQLGGKEELWNSSDPHLSIAVTGAHGQATTVHLIRDLSAWAPQRGAEWEPEKEALLSRFCSAIYDGDRDEAFLIAANDGQLLESWRRLKRTDEVVKTWGTFETLLVEDRQELAGVWLRFFNLSRGSSADLFDRALGALLSHEGWEECKSISAKETDFFGPNCPIRRNYELLHTDLVRNRLRALFELCDYNRLHVPIRQILILLSNCLLGHPDAKDRLMRPDDVPKVIQAGTVAKASLYNNIFGGNLTETRREAITVFDYLNRFRIGHETSNRIDNILIFGYADETLRPSFDELLGTDRFYGADQSYYAAQRAYVEGAEEDEADSTTFLDLLTSQRRGLFFKIPVEQEVELKLWELTVFKFAGEYLSRLVHPLRTGLKVDRPILARLIKGLNRIFVGMLVGIDRELILATSLSFSNAKVSRLLEDRVSVLPRLGEKVELIWLDGAPTIVVQLSETIRCPLQLHLTRYEFLSRVAEGALPNSFSKECYEDLLAFKIQVLKGLAKRQGSNAQESGPLIFRLLNLDDNGNPTEEQVEVPGAV